MAVGEWDRAVKRPEDVCASCEEKFGAEAIVVTALELTSEGFQRTDRCGACYDAEEREPFSFWRRALPKDLANRPRRLDLAFLSEFFRRLDGKDDAHARRVMWIVALLLLRKKILELSDRKSEGDVETLVLHFKNEEKEYEVADPQLDDEAMSSIEDDLARIFNLDTRPRTKAEAKPAIAEPAGSKTPEAGEADGSAAGDTPAS